MKIAQLTDLHLGRKNEDTYGVNTRSNFLRCLDDIRAYQPDLLVITGDICFREGDEKVYAWLKKQLQDLSFPLRFIPGNHDHTPTMTRALEIPFPLREGQLYYQEEFPQKNIHLFYTDSSSYRLSANQTLWLEQQLSKSPHRHLLLFIHHPPAKYTRDGYMDAKHALQNQEEVMAAIRRATGDSDRRLHIFCGHYHAEKLILLPAANVFITPSTFLQIDLQKENFAIDHYTPAWRKIEISPSHIATEVRYLFNHQTQIQ
ncbi:MAG TPA: hypothetical protein ENJ88_03680 [Phaeodactylibacter sp.]|nr:hypothetical protein [Phaeodactylibacter sp.]